MNRDKQWIQEALKKGLQPDGSLRLDRATLKRIVENLPPPSPVPKTPIQMARSLIHEDYPKYLVDVSLAIERLASVIEAHGSAREISNELRALFARVSGVKTLTAYFQDYLKDNKELLNAAQKLSPKTVERINFEARQFKRAFTPHRLLLNPDQIYEAYCCFARACRYSTEPRIQQKLAAISKVDRDLWKRALNLLNAP